MSRRISAVLFDLDGTLLEIDVQRFFPDYFGRLAAWLAELFPPAELRPRLMRSTRAMMANRDPRLLNREVFLADFFDGLGAPRDELVAKLDAFYREEFPKLSGHAKVVPGARAAVEKTLDTGRKAVLATSPVFPRVAVVERLGWAGLGDLPFALVTTYENMHSCKPHPEYYAEIASYLGCPAAECLMVGNDVEEDLAAQDVGMLTFLAGPNVIDRGQRAAAPDFRGTLADLGRILDGHA